MPKRAPTPAVTELLDRVHTLTRREPGTFTPSQVARLVDDHLAPRVKVGQPVDDATVGHYASVMTERSRNRGKEPLSFLYLAVIGYPVLPGYVTREIEQFIVEQLRNLTRLSRYVHPDQINRRNRYGYSTHNVFHPFEGAVIEQEHRREGDSEVRREDTYSTIRQHFVTKSETDGSERWEAIAEAKEYQRNTLDLGLFGGVAEDPGRTAEAVRGLVDPRFAPLITPELYEGQGKALTSILEWYDKHGMTPELITSMREHVAAGIIFTSDRQLKSLTPVDVVRSAIIPAIEDVMNSDRHS